MLSNAWAKRIYGFMMALIDCSRGWLSTYLEQDFRILSVFHLAGSSMAADELNGSSMRQTWLDSRFSRNNRPG